MSDAPETIWTCAHVGEYGHYFPEAVEAEAEYGGTATAYRRNDLPPTLSAAMQLPEVRALVEVAQMASEHYLDMAFHREGDVLRAALAPFTWAKP